MIPVIEERVKCPQKPGIQCIRLTDYSILLRENTQYKWLITLVPEPNRRSKYILAGGFIERIPFTDELSGKLQEAGKNGEPYVYAEAGIWYDALTAISELIGKTPNDETLKKRGLLFWNRWGWKKSKPTTSNDFPSRIYRRK